MKITILIGDPLSILLYATYTTIFYNILQYTLHYSLTTLPPLELQYRLTTEL
jgi:hypothetical protein